MFDVNRLQYCIHVGGDLNSKNLNNLLSGNKNKSVSHCLSEAYGLLKARNAATAYIACVKHRRQSLAHCR